jgi:hypothetical protein
MVVMAKRNSKTGHKVDPRKINALLNPKHVDAFVQAYQQAFGEQSFVAYTGLMRGYTRKRDSELLTVFKMSPHFSKFSNTIQDALDKSPVDFFSKDLAMVVLQPIGLAIEGSLQTIIGLIQMLSNIPALLKQKDNEMLLGMSRTWLGVSILLLAAVAPLARLYNAATRAYASVVEPKKSVRDEWQVMDVDVDVDDDVFDGDAKPTQVFRQLIDDGRDDQLNDEQNRSGNFII